MNINSISDFRKAMNAGPYAWPGGYPLFFILSDGEALSYKGARAIRREILEALYSKAKNGYCFGCCPVAFEINWEDNELYCIETNERIESAYGEDTHAQL